MKPIVAINVKSKSQNGFKKNFSDGYFGFKNIKSRDNLIFNEKSM